MSKLDINRKLAIALIVLVAVYLMFFARPKTAQEAQAPQTPAAAPVAAPATATEVKTAEAPMPAAETKSDAKLIVYRDKIATNHFVPSGYMPDGKCLTVNTSWKENCQEGTHCMKTVYDGECSKADQSWAGVYWLEPANNWGSEKGGYNISGAQRLVFWARGEKGGEVIDTFKVGGVIGPDHKYPDSDSAGIGPITLTKEWQEYSIDLKGKDLSYIVGGFAWAANVMHNPQGATFYLDNIYFE